MSGIHFMKTEELEEIKDFYTNKIGMDIWVDQGQCVILKHGNMLLGFCEADEPDTDGVITFFYEDKKQVNEMYDMFEDSVETKPKENETYNIYNFFAKDVEGRTIEFQTFLHPLEPYIDAVELLEGRRSVRDFEEKEVPENVLKEIFETCRYAPTSRNSQSYYFIPIHDRETIEFMAERRAPNSAPIAEAPMAVAICCDPDKTGRVEQDGDIAAYHFMLTAWAHGLGTCWIAAMDREDVKNRLGIEQEHYVATVTPLGYPMEIPKTPSRKPSEEFVRELI
ncbi:MAG: nitroreductase family protein [Candidatus Saliniplasma sp.]